MYNRSHIRRRVSCSTTNPTGRPTAGRSSFNAMTGTAPAPPNRADGGPQYSPDGGTLAFERDIVTSTGDTITSAIFVMNADGGDARRLTPWKLRAGDHPDWSPNGKRILFHSNQDGPDS